MRTQIHCDLANQDKTTIIAFSADGKEEETVLGGAQVGISFSDRTCCIRAIVVKQEYQRQVWFCYVSKTTLCQKHRQCEMQNRNVMNGSELHFCSHHHRDNHMHFEYACNILRVNILPTQESSYILLQSQGWSKRKRKPPLHKYLTKFSAKLSYFARMAIFTKCLPNELSISFVHQVSNITTAFSNKWLAISRCTVLQIRTTNHYVRERFNYRGELCVPKKAYCLLIMTCLCFVERRALARWSLTTWLTSFNLSTKAFEAWA